ncbi:MAG TPA: hypothetical protein ENK44_00065 [Caldithrix abyssi]|uniref:Uncharacterized protein n=1 Tax=Caldithrix abyssi TaxID=187145 RepID=A0A7V4TX30_CALAY|nr:hypothetical protein [Caldithrix abyssi]
MSLWENLKKGVLEGLQAASDKTSEYTRIGRIKIDVLGLKKEIEEKFVELGGRVYHNAIEKKIFSIEDDKEIQQLIEQLKDLEAELKAYDEELKRIKEEDGVDLD